MPALSAAEKKQLDEASKTVSRLTGKLLKPTTKKPVATAKATTSAKKAAPAKKATPKAAKKP